MDEGGVRHHRPLTSLLPGPGEQATPLLQNSGADLRSLRSLRMILLCSSRGWGNVIDKTPVPPKLSSALRRPDCRASHGQGFGMCPAHQPSRITPGSIVPTAQMQMQ